MTVHPVTLLSMEYILVRQTAPLLGDMEIRLFKSGLAYVSYVRGQTLEYSVYFRRERANLIVHVTSGGQKCSTDHVGYYSYAPPVITSFTPQYGSTDGTTLIDVIGLNFGTNAAHVSLEFVRTAGGTPTGHKYTSIASTHNHLSLSSVRMPEGQGGNIAIQVNVSGQISAPFIRPAIANINIEPYSPTLISLQPGEMYLPPFCLVFLLTMGRHRDVTSSKICLSGNSDIWCLVEGGDNAARSSH